MTTKNIFILFLFFSFHLNAQTGLKINHKGEANANQINVLIQEKGYQAVSAFDTVSRAPVLVYAIYLKNNQFGILDIYGKEITPAIYDDIPALNRDYTQSLSGFKPYFTVVKKGKYGVIDQQGKMLIPFKYNHIRYTTYKYAGVENKNPAGDENAIVFEARYGDEYFFLDVNNKIVKPSTPVDDRLVDVDDESTSKPRPTPKTTTPYGKVTRNFRNGYQIISKKVDGENTYGLYDSHSDKLIMATDYLQIKEGIDNHFIVQNKKEQYGIVDSTGRTVLKFQYDRINDLIRTHYTVYKNKKMALFSRDFKPLTKFVYDSSSSSNADYFSFNKNGKLRVVTATGKEISDFEFDRVKFYRREYKKPLIIATLNQKKGIIDSLGNVVLNFTHDILLPNDKIKTEGYSLRASGDFTGTTNPSFFFFKKDKKYGIYDNQYQIILNDYDNIVKSQVKDLIYISKKKEDKNKWGIYNLKTGQIVLAMNFDNRIKYYRGGYFNFDKYYSGGFFMVKKNETYGLYDETGKEWLPTKEVNRFKVDLIYNGLIKIESKDEYSYMDTYGNRTKSVKRNNN